MKIPFATVINFLYVLAGVQAKGKNGIQFTNAHHDSNSAWYEVNITQNYVVNQTILQVECTDTQNARARITYSLHSTDRFAIDQVTGTIIRLIVDGLTFVHGTTYSATVQCTSQSNNGIQHGSATLRVTYFVMNEFTPVFLNYTSPLKFVFTENNNITGNKSVIYDFNAEDQDRGVCGRIIYRIESRHTPEVFQIDRNTGVLSFTRPLDYEMEDRHTIQISAGSPNRVRCSSPAPRIATATVYINVEDINDTPPQFESDIYNVSVEENSSPSDLVTVSCRDPDTNSHVIYSISNTHNVFVIDAAGTVSFTEKLDYERNTMFTIMVSCEDTEGISEQIDYAQINIAILPVNEHRPVITPNSRLFSIEDTTPQGTILVSPVPGSNALRTYTVTDHDRGLDHNQYYFTINESEIDEKYRSCFALNHTTGELTLQKRLEKTQCGQDGIPPDRIDFSITVCDIPDVKVCSMLSITIHVTIADCIPHFPQQVVALSLKESTITGTKLLSLPCEDFVNTTNKTVTILQDSHAPQPFSYHQQDGYLVLAQSLDYEQKRVYTFRLMCDNSYSSEAFVEVEVRVIPENDNPPFFDKPVYLINITNQVQNVPQLIGQIEAQDLDKDVGGNITYSLTKPSQYFTVDQNGHMYVSDSIPNSEKVFVLEIRASDGNFSVNATIVILQDSVDSMSKESVDSMSKHDHKVLIIVFSVVLFLMALLLVVSWIWCLSCRRSRGKYRKGRGLQTRHVVQER